MISTAGLLGTLETYYDAAPRPSATTEECGPFTLFLRSDPTGWPFYARPRLGLDDEVAADDVRGTRERQRRLGAPETFEWVHETTPSVVAAARAAGLSVAENPLLVLDGTVATDATHRVEGIGADDPRLPRVLGAVGAGFRGNDTVTPTAPGHRRTLMEAGRLIVVAAFDESGEVVGGGSHGPRGTTTELTGIAVLPRARRQGLGAAITHALVTDAGRRGVDTVFLSAQDDTVARVYERVGFVRVGTACVAAAP